MRLFAFVLVFLLCKLPFASAESYNSNDYSEDDGQQHQQKERSIDSDDYHIYDLIDQMTTITPHRTFYELLGVSERATEAEIGQKFRTASRAWHPDKNKSEEARQMYTLLGGAAEILRSEVRRLRYNWILHDAPPWHRSSVRLVRKFKVTKRLSMWQVALMTLFGALLVQLLAQWAIFGVESYTRWSAQRSLHAMNPRELRKLQRRLDESSNPQALALSNAAFQDLIDSQRPQPLAPRPWSLFVFWPVSWILSLLLQKRSSS